MARRWFSSRRPHPALCDHCSRQECLAKYGEILRIAARYDDVRTAVYAEVRANGTVQRSDAITLFRHPPGATPADPKTISASKMTVTETICGLLTLTTHGSREMPLIALGLPTMKRPIVGAPADGPLIDTFGRVATNLQVSLTDRSNPRCAYCMPPAGLNWLPREQLLTLGPRNCPGCCALRSLGSASPVFASPAASRCCPSTSKRSSPRPPLYGRDYRSC
jgi:hypothetical protein